MLNENVKDYIPSLKEEDIGRISVIGGKICLLESNGFEKEATKKQKMEIIDGSEVEEKAINGIVKSRGENSFEYNDESEKQYIGGIELVEKNLANADKWKIVTESGENGKIRKTYDEGYYYIPKGITIDGIGNITYGYIVNYDNNNVIRYKEGTHKYLSYESTLGVTDGLIFNADPGVMDEYNSLDENEKKTFDTSKLGENVEFYGYNGADGKLDLSQAFTKSSFIFDGKDDYIEFPYDDTNKFQNGFTFEFYGRIHGKGGRCDKGETKEKETNGSGEVSSGLLHIYGPEVKNDDFWGARFSYYCKDDRMTGIGFTLCPKNSEWGKSIVEKLGWSRVDAKWYQRVDFSSDFNKDVYFTIVYDALASVEVLYVDGKEGEKAEIDKLYWDCFMDQIDNVERRICVGRIADNNPYNWLYADFECYSMRIYRRALDEDEVLKNFEASVDYHYYLEQNVQ